MAGYGGYYAYNKYYANNKKEQSVSSDASSSQLDQESEDQEITPKGDSGPEKQKEQQNEDQAGTVSNPVQTPNVSEPK